MKFINNVIELYDLLISNNELQYGVNSLADYLKLIDDNLYSQNLRTYFKEDMSSVIDSKLSFCKKDIEYIRKLKEVSWYEDSMAVYSTIIIFWAKSPCPLTFCIGIAMRPICLQRCMRFTCATCTSTII